MSQLFRYSILLWGQFDLVFQHAVQGKAVVKQFSLVVNAGANLFEVIPAVKLIPITHIVQSSFVAISINSLKQGMSFHQQSAQTDSLHRSSIKSTSTARSLSMKMQSPAHRYIIRVSPSESALLERLDASCIETGRLAQEASRKLQQTVRNVS
jgi:hypothetical protein